MNNNGYMVATSGNITLFVNGKTYCVDKSHTNYDLILSKAKSKDYGEIPDLINKATAVKKQVANTPLAEGLVITDNSVTYKGFPLNGLLVDKILEFTRNKYDCGPLVKFLTNLMENPSKTSVDTLYNFLEKYGLVITEDGYFIGYKKVQDNLTDYHTGTFKNEIGKTVSVPRNTVDDRPEAACSYGLHVGSLDYAHNQFHHGQGKLLTVLVNPKDVVSVTTDCEWAKIRVCEYLVLSYNDDAKEVVQTGTVVNYDDSGDYDDEDNDYDESYDDELDEEEDDDDDWDDDDEDDSELDNWADEDDEDDDEDDEKDELETTVVTPVVKEEKLEDWAQISKSEEKPTTPKEEKTWWAKFWS